MSHHLDLDPAAHHYALNLTVPALPNGDAPCWHCGQQREGHKTHPADLMFAEKKPKTKRG